MAPVLLTLASCLLVLGCGEPGQETDKKYPVKGTVTLDGQPLADGEVYFKTAGTPDIVPIVNGQFDGMAQAGKGKVEIYAYRMETPPPEAMPGYTFEPTKTNYLPAKWNMETTLTEEVKASGANEYKFEVTSK